MTDYFVGPGGNDSNDGQTWATRKLTLGGAEALALVGGDVVYVAPGTYREQLTVGESGGSLYTAGTVSVTQGSKTVTGSGTSWSANAYANGWFQVPVLAGGTDGVTGTASATFNSAAGNFQASMVGMAIRINTVGLYRIAAVVSATQITLDRNAANANTSLTYEVGPEAPHEIASVDSDTQLTLKEPYSGVTATALAYETWQDIRFVADTGGQNTDGVGGAVRLTGSDNDQTATRSSALSITTKNYRTFRGFAFDFTTSYMVYLQSSPTHIIIEDCFYQSMGGNNAHLFVYGGALNCTFRRSILIGGASSACSAIYFSGLRYNNSRCLIENVVLLGTIAYGMYFRESGGVRVRNCTFISCQYAIETGGNMNTGQGVHVHNCIFTNCYNAFENNGPQLNGGDGIIEDYNDLAQNVNDRRFMTVTGPHDVGFPPLFDPPLLRGNGLLEPWTPFALMAASQMRNRAGLGGYPTDLYGIQRPQEGDGDWGAVEALPIPTKDASVYDGASGSSLKLPRRGYQDVLVPVKANVQITVSVKTQWASNANIGLKPALQLLADYSVSPQEADAVGDGSAWETLSITVTPNTDGVMVARLLNRSTYSADIAVWFDTLAVT